MGLGYTIVQQRRIVLVVAVLCFGASVWAFSGSLWPPSRVTEDALPDTATPEDVELQSILMAVRRTWHPDERADLIQAAKPRFPDLEASLLRVLLDAEHRLLREAVLLAAGLRPRAALTPLRDLAKRPRIGAQAVLAAQQVEPWPTDALREILRSEHQDVLIAALEVAKSCDPYPHEECFALLVHDDPTVRAAAAAAVPERLSVPAVARLRSMVVNEHGPSRIAAIGALSRTQATDSTDALVYDLLRNLDRDVQIAALDLLAGRRSPLSRPEEIWALVQESAEELEVRARAAWCLEQTASGDVTLLEREEAVLPPYLRYLVARCLIQGGSLRGIGVLVELLELPAEAFMDLSPVEVQHVQGGMRRLLESMSGILYYEGLPAWRTWYRSLEGLDREHRIQLLKVSPFLVDSGT